MLLILAAAGIVFSLPSSAADNPPLKVATSYYADSRQFTTASIAVSSNNLPLGVTLWGFSDFHGDHDSDSFALTRSFSEYRLSRALSPSIVGLRGLGIQLEADFISGSGNDVTRAGLTYRHALPLPWKTASAGWLQWRAFPWESREHRRQASLIFFLPLKKHVQLRGFADYNISSRGKNRWVVEPELNVRLAPKLWGLIEYRYNQFEESNPSVDGRSLAIGLRYEFLN